jgi:RNA ligase
MDEITSIADIQKLAIKGFTNWAQYGYVTVRKYENLLIFNYNTMAQYEGRWNFFETVSRGLIIDCSTGEIVARPMDKFFNWLQGGRRAHGHIVTVTEKVDGSIGVLYRTSNGYRIATRGSFTSTQAEWATAFLNANFDLTGLPNELTLLFEIIYPDNRIIVNYGQREDLVLLAARNRFTGDYLPFFPDLYEMAQQYGFSLPKVFAFNDLTQIFERTGELDANEEGYVVEFSDGSRFKFKGDHYVYLQRLIMSLTFKNVLRGMESGKIQDMIELVPDEFLDEVKKWMIEISATIDSVKMQVQSAFDSAPKDSRKEFALWAQTQKSKIRPYLFALFDDRDITPMIYKEHDWKYQESGAEIE